MADAALQRSGAKTGAEPRRSPSIMVDDVHVIYRVFEDRKPTLRTFVSSRFRPRPHREVHAVRGVSIKGHPGEVIGIIGRNGSGKSTLLRAMAGLMPTTQGAVYAHSQPALLGVGAALNAQLSGRRNVVLGGLALGMSRREIDERFDEIVEFAGLTDFIDMPLRTYSSGMAARLHFSIASAVLPEILLIDEALAVGDEDFKDKSNQRIQELRERAGTVFVVSHNLPTILGSCTRAIWMSEGMIVEDGDPEGIVGAYRSWIRGESQTGSGKGKGKGKGKPSGGRASQQRKDDDGNARRLPPQ